VIPRNERFNRPLLEAIASVTPQQDAKAA
jgi:hypothetical protein